MKNWFFVSLAIVFAMSIEGFCESSEANITAREYIMINLGENCSARGALEAVDIKQESYPFDSCIVPFHALIKCLEEDFQDYTNPEYFIPYIDNQSPINKYGVVLAHSFPLVSVGKKENGEDVLVMDPKWRDVLSIVEEKYERRITRFRQACTSSKKVCFFRYLDIDYAKADQLSNLLHKCYPNLDFLLVCVQNISSDRERQRDWNLPRVKNLYFNTSAVSPHEEWTRIFQDANLIN